MQRRLLTTTPKRVDELLQSANTLYLAESDARIEAAAARAAAGRRADYIDNRPWTDDLPRAAYLRMSDVRQLERGKLSHLLVVEPQWYSATTRLTRRSEELSWDPPPRSPRIRDDGGVGYFHTGESGVAQTGDGGDGGDSWLIAGDTLVRHLRNYIDNQLYLQDDPNEAQ